MKVFLHNAPKTRVITSLISMVLGGAVIGVTSGIVITDVDFFYGFSLAFSQGGGSSEFSFAATAMIAAAVGGGLMVAAGLFGLAGHFARSQLLLVLFLLLTFVGSLVAIVGGGMFTRIPPTVGERLYIDDTNSIDPPLAGLEKDMNDFELAIFNECCIPRNWTEQRTAVPCTGNNANDCPAITDTLVTNNVPNAQVLLCSCASSAQKLLDFQNAIRATGFCKKARKAFIKADNVIFPSKVPGNLYLKTLVEQRDPGGTVLLEKIPLVGWHKNVARNPDQTEVPDYPESFGCGFGYQKGIAWMTDIWFQQHTVQPAYGVLGIGLVNLCFIIVAIVISIMQTVEDKEFSSGKVDKWDAVKDIPSQFANTANPIHQPHSMVVATASQPSSAHTSLASSQQKQPSQPAGVDKGVIFEQLRAFYALHDKDKNLSDVDDVASWTVLNGIDALNAKLRSKYNADLDALARKPSAGVGLGAKALQHDLDI